MQYYFAIIKYYIALSAGGGDSRIFQPLFFMSTFQERILAASGSSSSTADTDPELYRYRSASSEEYLESCNYRVWSTELSDRFLVWWMCPVGRDEAEQRSLERELRSDEESPLHIPLEIFMVGRCRGRGGGAVGRRCRLPCAGVRLHRRVRLFSTVVFSPRHSSRKRGSAHLA